MLPRLLAKLQAAGASKRVTGVVIPTGYSFNLDGTCIYLTLGALFIVQAAGQDMPLATQIGLLALMVLTSKGAAGITGAGLVTLTASLQAFGGDYFSAEAIAVGIALVVGIDRIMSEGRALTNAIGNSVATMVIAKWQGELDEEQFQRALRSPGDVERATDDAMSGREPTERFKRVDSPEPAVSGCLRVLAAERTAAWRKVRFGLPRRLRRREPPRPSLTAAVDVRRTRGDVGAPPALGGRPSPALEPRDVLEAARVADLVTRRRASPWRASAGPCRHRSRPSSCRAAARRSRRTRDRGSCRR